MRDWQEWHAAYDDPQSDLSRRLAVVQERIRAWADGAQPGPLRLVSMCAGEGRDVVGALAEHPRRGDVTGLLVELDERNVAAARRSLESSGLRGISVARGDAGASASYEPSVPADLVVACGVFGNIPDDEVAATVAQLATLCAPGATVVWTRHRRDPDLTTTLRSWFGSAGFEELDFTSPGPGRFAVGTHRLTADPAPYVSQRRLFSMR